MKNAPSLWQGWELLWCLLKTINNTTSHKVIRSYGLLKRYCCQTWLYYRVWKGKIICNYKRNLKYTPRCGQLTLCFPKVTVFQQPPTLSRFRNQLQSKAMIYPFKYTEINGFRKVKLCLGLQCKANFKAVYSVTLNLAVQRTNHPTGCMYTLV